MKQTPEQPQPDLFDPPVEKPIKMYPPDLNVRESTGYVIPVKQTREQIIRESNQEEVLSPHETYGSFDNTDDFRFYDKRKATQEDIEKLVEVVKEATKED